MRELEARKRLLVAESEVYRQTLRFHVQNARLYKIHMQRKFAVYAALGPALMMVAPLIASLFLRHDRQEVGKPERRSWVSNLVSGWRMYEELQPLISTIMSKCRRGLASRADDAGQAKAEHETPPGAVAHE